MFHCYLRWIRWKTRKWIAFKWKNKHWTRISLAGSLCETNWSECDVFGKIPKKSGEKCGFRSSLKIIWNFYMFVSCLLKNTVDVSSPVRCWKSCIWACGVLRLSWHCKGLLWSNQKYIYWMPKAKVCVDVSPHFRWFSILP